MRNGVRAYLEEGESPISYIEDDEAGASPDPPPPPIPLQNRLIPGLSLVQRDGSAPPFAPSHRFLEGEPGTAAGIEVSPQSGGVADYGVDTSDDGALPLSPESAAPGVVRPIGAADPAQFNKAASAYEQAVMHPPKLTPPKPWQRVVSGALGGLAGWSNAASRTRTPIDIGAMSEGILHPGYGEKMAQYEAGLKPLQTVAEIEGQKYAAQQGAAKDTATINHLNAQSKYYESMRGMTVPVTPELAEMSGGALHVGGPPIPATLAVEYARIAAGKYVKPEPADKTMVVNDADLATWIGVKPGTAVPITTYNAGLTSFRRPDPVEQENLNRWIATSLDPGATPEAKKIAEEKIKRLREAQVATRISINAANPVNQPAAEVKVGSPEYTVARDLATGKLTMQQFGRLYSYSRDVNKKLSIYQKAEDVNPNFNPAMFEMGYTFSRNPRIQQQIASLNNVESGVPDLLKFSDLATRTGAPILNRAIIPGGIAVGGKRYSNFATARTAFADELSGALGYGSATDMSREMGFDMTNPSLSPDAFRSSIQDVVVPFVNRKRASLLGPMGPYGAAGMNPNAQGPQIPTPGGPGRAPGAQANTVTVVAPDGSPHNFANQAQANEFKKLAGIK